MAFIDIWTGWLWFAGMAIALGIALTSVIYMLSELLQNDKMKGWAKMELTEIVYSALIISVAIFGVQLVDSVVQGGLGVSNTGGGSAGTMGCSGSATSAWILTTDYGDFIGKKSYRCYDICDPRIAESNLSVYHGVESCHMRLGMWYLREIFDEAKSFAFDTYLSYTKTSMIAEFTINIEFLFEKAGFFTFTPWKGFYTMGNKVKELAFDWAIKLMMLTKFQEVLLRFISTALFPALFIIGALLRTFTFTRRLGGLLLAMAIALYFVFPSFYAFGALVMLDIKNNPDVVAAWRTSEANPCYATSNPNVQPEDCADPPISNSMYILNMTIYMPGGNSTGYGDAEVRERLSYYEGLDPRTYYGYMEQGRDNQGGTLPLSDSSGRVSDFSAQSPSTSASERDARLTEARRQADNWFGIVNKESKIDRFVDMAWSANGPLDVLGRLTFWSVFFSLFGIIGTIAAIRSLSTTFGGDIEIAGLTRLI